MARGNYGQNLEKRELINNTDLQGRKPSAPRSFHALNTARRRQGIERPVAEPAIQITFVSRCRTFNLPCPFSFLLHFKLQILKDKTLDETWVKPKFSIKTTKETGIFYRLRIRARNNLTETPFEARLPTSVLLRPLPEIKCNIIKALLSS
jgi:hypothetical protein